jgi:hypothetical protein
VPVPHLHGREHGRTSQAARREAAAVTGRSYGVAYDAGGITCLACGALLADRWQSRAMPWAEIETLAENHGRECQP